MKKVCVFVAPGLEECEALVPVDLLRRAGVEVTLAAVGGSKTVTGSHHITFEADALAEELDMDGFDMLFLPGGMPGTKNLKVSETVCAALKSFAAKGKDLAAICAAPSVLGALGLLQGRRAVCYPGYEKELLGAQPGEGEIAQDGNILTGKGLGATIPFALAMIARLKTKEEAEAIGKQIVWPYGLGDA